MVLIKPGVGISELKGKQGGTVFQKSRFGQVMKGLGRPKRKPSILQQKRRAQNSTIANRWNETLTQSERDAWNTYAANTPWTNKFGDTVFLTGQQHHQRNNNFYQLNSPASYLSAPTAYGLPSAPDIDTDYLTYLLSGSQLIITSDGWITNYDWEDTGEITFLYMGYPQKGNPEYNRKYVFARSFQGTQTVPKIIYFPITNILDSIGYVPVKLVRKDNYNRFSLPSIFKVITEFTP